MNVLKMGTDVRCVPLRSSETVAMRAGRQAWHEGATGVPPADLDRLDANAWLRGWNAERDIARNRQHTL